MYSGFSAAPLWDVGVKLFLMHLLFFIILLYYSDKNNMTIGHFLPFMKL